MSAAWGIRPDGSSWSGTGDLAALVSSVDLTGSLGT
jgi:hypothetical protein